MIKFLHAMADTANLIEDNIDTLIENLAFEAGNKDKNKRKIEFCKELKEKRKVLKKSVNL